jgi:hypothetical protein
VLELSVAATRHDDLPTVLAKKLQSLAYLQRPSHAARLGTSTSAKLRL